MKKIIGIPVLLVLIFYYIYPQALPILGSSFIFGSAIVGLCLFIYHGRIYPEVIKIALYYSPFVIWCLVADYFNATGDSFLFTNTKTHLGWLFSAYLIANIFFAVHTKGKLLTFIYYIIAAILIQAVIAIAMYQNEAINDFFTSIQMADALAQYKREETEGTRLMGYGTAFFGAGVIYGAGLLFVAYVILKKKLNLFMTVFWAAIYSAIFFIGLLSARTTLVGCLCSFLLIFILLLFNKNTEKGQFFKFIAVCVLFVSIGTSLCYMYFPEFADWAFEAFINYQKTGEFRTKSSDGLESMFMLPENLQQWIFGIGRIKYWGPDVGYTRLLFYFGLPGTLAFLLYQLALSTLAFTRDRALNYLLLMLFVCNLMLNIKALSDLSGFVYLFVFYFVYYKYNIYIPHLSKIGKFNSTKLRYAVQGSSSRRRV